MKKARVLLLCFLFFSSLIIADFTLNNFFKVSRSKPLTNTLATNYEILGPQGTPVSTNGPRIPVGWTLEPAGTQISTLSQPDGVSLSPNGQYVFVPTSGQWDESLGVINTSNLTIQNPPAASAFLGVASDDSGNIWLSGGGKDKIYHYFINSSGQITVPPNSTSIVPPLANPPGISVPGYPGNMVLGQNSWLYITATLPISQSTIDSYNPGATCPSNQDLFGNPGNNPAPSSCSVIISVNVSNPQSTTPPINLIPVGQDAYSVAYSSTYNTLYVSNWADSSNPLRAGGTGTVSVIKLASGGGSGSEVQAIPVGSQPMGLALSPQGNEVVVANSRSNSISIIDLNSQGLASRVYSVPVGLSNYGIRGSQPSAVAFDPTGRYIFVTLFGLNAVEVLNADGSPISQTIKVMRNDSVYSVVVPFTLIPVGWMPIAITTGSSPNGSGYRIYVANFQGMGTGPGFYDPASNDYGTNELEGSVSAITLSSNSSTEFGQFTAQTISADDLLAFVDPQFSSAQTNGCDSVPMPNGSAVSSNLICQTSQGSLISKYLHVVIILRENKTVDSMLGYLSQALSSLNSTSAYETYGPMITANLAKIAQTYGINDNNWVAGDESETGHSTLTGGETTPPTELFVHVDNDFGLRGNRNGDPLSYNPTTRLADEVLNAGFSEVTYGGDLNPNSPANANEIPEAIWGNAPSQVFSGTNTDFPDTNRANIFISGVTVDQAWDTYNNVRPPQDFGKTIGLCGGPNNFCNYPGASPTDYSKYSLAGWEASYNQCINSGGNQLSCQTTMPNFAILELPDDHTDVFNSGNNPLMWAPQVMVANNDYATGEIIQALSRSPFWKYTLVMIVEDDTQFTADHVNVLRSYIVTAGGLARPLGAQNNVSHQVSSFCAIDKTVEDLFKLQAMSVCDASSYPLDSLIVNQVPISNPPVYKAVMPQIPIMLPYPSPDSVRMIPWCANDKPTEIGFTGLLHFQVPECFGSYVGYLAKTLNIG